MSCGLNYTLSVSADSVMPRSHIHGSPRRFYYGLNLTDDPGNAMDALYTYDKVQLRMITDAIRKATDQNGLPRTMPDCIVANPASSP